MDSRNFPNGAAGMRCGVDLQHSRLRSTRNSRRSLCFDIQTFKPRSSSTSSPYRRKRCEPSKKWMRCFRNPHRQFLTEATGRCENRLSNRLSTAATFLCTIHCTEVAHFCPHTVIPSAERYSILLKTHSTQVANRTTNQKVGSSTLSGRATLFNNLETPHIIAPAPV
jgi:hypothetical protein